MVLLDTESTHYDPESIHSQRHPLLPTRNLANQAVSALHMTTNLKKNQESSLTKRHPDGTLGQS
jgi:hypothetical protein